ncbi:MAG: NRDE family protein [Cyclobacteriaceae bacterium]|nr:NRDE family protein [Cyclobacteriaceae bacterium]
MCLIFLSVNNHPSYKLVVAANRDEFYSRKTATAHFWEDHPHIVGGRDLEAHGTWMAMTKRGRISLVTNYRDPKNIDPHAPSRGQLVTDYLNDSSTPEVYLSRLANRAKAYNGFNLLVGDTDALWYYSNYRDGLEKISPGLYGLSNHLLETPWPKVLRGKQKMAEALATDHVNPENLFELLKDDVIADDKLLPDTGIGLERERALSSMFIKSPGYGTRCSTVVIVDRLNHVLFSERVYDTTTFHYSTQRFEFDIKS